MNTLIRLILVMFALVVLSHAASAQIVTDDKPQTADKPQKPLEDRAWKRENFYFGGFPVFGIGGNSYGTSFAVGLSAEAGYFVHERVSVGIRTSYAFSNYRDSYGSQKLHSILGGPFVRGYIWKGLFGQAEYQFSSLLFSINDPSLNADITVRNNSLLIGGGYHDNFDSYFGYYIAALFRVYNSGTNLFPGPEVRIGFTYRLPSKN